MATQEVAQSVPVSPLEEVNEMAEDVKTGTRFTPGPWSVGAPGGHNVSNVYARNDSIAAVFCLPMHTTRDEMKGGEAFGGKFREGWFNAHLIAAAPELYEALDNAAEAIGSLAEDALGYANDGWSHWPIRDELMAKIGTALAKARGE